MAKRFKSHAEFLSEKIDVVAERLSCLKEYRIGQDERACEIASETDAPAIGFPRY